MGDRWERDEREMRERWERDGREMGERWERDGREMGERRPVFAVRRRSCGQIHLDDVSRRIQYSTASNN